MTIIESVWFDLAKPVRCCQWSIKPKEIAEILYLIEKQQQNGAVLIHCYHAQPYRFDCRNVPHHLSRLVGRRGKSRNATGPYGYHSIWKNIANLFTEEKVKQVNDIWKPYVNAVNTKI